MRSFLLLFRYPLPRKWLPYSGWLKLKERKKSIVSRGVARIFSRGTHRFKNPCPLPLPLQIWKLLHRIFFIISLTSLCCILQARRNEFEQMALKVACVILWAERLVHVGGSGVIFPRKILKIWTSPKHPLKCFLLKISIRYRVC